MKKSQSKIEKNMFKNNTQNVVCIKLGGSVITNKEVPMMVRTEVLNRLIDEIARAKRETDDLYVIGHGQGSFAHAPAMRYRTMEGFVSKDSQIGMAITQDSAAQLNRIVVKAFLAADLPAVSYCMSNTLVTKAGHADQYDPAVLLRYLENGLLPVSGGDVLVDSQQGCTIWSTETVLSFLIDQLTHYDYSVKRIIHVTEVAGVLDAKGEVVPEITPANQSQIYNMIGQTKGFDVTGGMKHKIAESLALAESGVESCIVSGMQSDNLYRVLCNNQTVKCTTIRKESAHPNAAQTQVAQKEISHD